MMLVSCIPALSSSTDVLIEYRRSGGFAGLDDHLIIKKNGEATLTRRGKEETFRLDSTQLDRVSATFEKAQFTKLKKKYLPKNQGRDLISYVVQYKGHQIQTADTAIPEALLPVIELLNEIVLKKDQL